MLIREFTYGHTPCLVQAKGTFAADGTSVYTGELFVLEQDGRALRRIGDRAGTAVTLSADCAEAVLNQAAAYLHARFGPLAREKAVRVQRSVRPITEPPLRDERSEEPC